MLRITGCGIGDFWESFIFVLTDSGFGCIINEICCWRLAGCGAAGSARRLGANHRCAAVSEEGFVFVDFLVYSPVFG